MTGIRPDSIIGLRVCLPALNALYRPLVPLLYQTLAVGVRTVVAPGMLSLPKPLSGHSDQQLECYRPPTASASTSTAPTSAIMASLLTTMFVPFHSSPPAQALPPHCTLKQSSSCVTVNSYTFLETPESPNTYSPSSRAAQLLRHGLVNSPKSDNGSPSSNARTRGQFKPQRTTKGTTSYQLRQFAEATLGSGSLRKAVKLPEGEDLNEWLAVNGTHLASRTGPLILMQCSRRLLQPDQPPLRFHHRVLLPTVMSRDESYRRVPIPLPFHPNPLTIPSDSNTSGKTPPPASPNPPRCPPPSISSTS